MSLRRTIHRIIAWWLARRLERSAPELAEIRREIEARRRKHQPVRRLLRIQRELVHAGLAAELGVRNPTRRTL